ncbi:MAG: MarR family transcriptional regulator [Paenibacillus sp.]|uniref:MarR family winged helix-turn-helix transcriptional regulator n=1 Tax=Paenibacillus sp. TaxID=58172 RepID=UPI00207DEA38|nr:MarR family transcriptional regulator [Paenibacillus sp.]MDU2238989.1 MarR family transcriptional regulator [Paenibacillus sp.]GJM80224.1 MarR family transcriptional regulator [Paenibacillus sp. HMSSN-139]
MDQKQRMHDIVESFREVKRAFYQLLSKQAEPFGITGIQFMTLKRIQNNPQIGVTELADQLRMGNSTVSGVVDRLVKAGLVVRERLDEDRRSVVLQITDKGMEVYRQTDLEYTKAITSVLETAEKDIDHMLQTHHKIIASLEKVREETYEP